MEVDSDKARRLRDEYRAGLHELLAPEHFLAEIANSLLVAERRGRYPKGDYPKHLANVLTTMPQLRSTIPLLPRVSILTAIFQVSVYDCLYVALAEQEGCEFATADDKLVKNLQKQFPFIVPLATLP